MAVLPFFHLYGHGRLMAAALRRGATLVTMPRFDLEQFLAVLQDYRVTRAAVVPPIVLALAKQPMVDRFDLLVAAARSARPPRPSAPSWRRRAASGSDCVVGQGYGLTETSPGLTAPAHPTGPGSATARSGRSAQHRGQDRRPRHRGGAGPRPGRRAVLPRPPGDGGLPRTGRRDRQMLDADGWLRTGDIGYVDDDGYFYVVDRVKELIKYKG